MTTLAPEMTGSDRPAPLRPLTDRSKIMGISPAACHSVEHRP